MSFNDPELSRDDWIADAEDENVESTVYETKETILFCIDANQSMHKPKTSDDKYSGKSNLYMALRCAVELQKRKVLYSPSDSVGVLLYNTENTSGEGDLKPHHQLLQIIRPINASQIKELAAILEGADQDSDHLMNKFAPYKQGLTIGDVLTCCMSVFRTFAPKTSVKRVFLITDNDRPMHSPHDVTVASQKFSDLTDTGATIVPFFLSNGGTPFDVDAFYADAFPSLYEAGNMEVVADPVDGFSDLMNEMRIRESMKRALFSIPFQLGDGLTIGVKGYGLVTEQKRSAYRKFANLGHTMEEAIPVTAYIDSEQQIEVDKQKIVYSHSHAIADDDGYILEGEEESKPPPRRQTFFSGDEVKSFRTLGLNPGLKVLGFEAKDTLTFQDNIRHAYFIYPDEKAYTGSTRAFNALLKATINKDKIVVARFLPRRGSSPSIVALVPQQEKFNERGQQAPSGFHIITYPFADEIRVPPSSEATEKASKEQTEVACRIIEKLTYKGKGYDPDSFLSPSLGLHYGQLQALAFDQAYDPDNDFTDTTRPEYDTIHQRAGSFIAQLKDLISADQTNKPEHREPTPSGGSSRSKRKAETDIDEAHLRDAWTDGRLQKFKVEELKSFLKGKGQPVAGRKADLVAKVEEWFAVH